jgi:hypothetical protein
MASGRGEGYLDIALDIASDSQRFWVEIDKGTKGATERDRKWSGRDGKEREEWLTAIYGERERGAECLIFNKEWTPLTLTENRGLSPIVY